MKNNIIKGITKEIDKSPSQWRLNYKLLLGAIIALGFVVSVLFYNALDREKDYTKELQRVIKRLEEKDNECDKKLAIKDRMIDSTRAYLLNIILSNNVELQEMKRIQQIIKKNPIKIKNQIITVSEDINKLKNEN